MSANKGVSAMRKAHKKESRVFIKLMIRLYFHRCKNIN